MVELHFLTECSHVERGLHMHEEHVLRGGSHARDGERQCVVAREKSY